MDTSTCTQTCSQKTQEMYTAEIMNTLKPTLGKGTHTTMNCWKKKKNCLRTNQRQLISAHEDRQNHTDIRWAQLKDTTLTLLRESQRRCRWDWIQTCLLTGKIELLISQQIVLWGIHGSTPWLSNCLWLKDCVWNRYTLYICVCGCLPGKQDALVKVPVIFCGKNGQCGLPLRQDRANSESIKLMRVMHAEGRLRPRCAERALTARTQSGFCTRIQAEAQSPALNATSRKGGNCIFYFSFLPLLIMQWNKV